MRDVVTIGESMVLFVPQKSGLLRNSSVFDRSIAGAESNLAVGLARLGHRVGWMSRLGNDEFGEAVLNFLRAEGVDVSAVHRDDRAPTAVFFKERRRAGSSRVFYYRSGSAASRMVPGDLSEEYIRGARCLHLTGITPALGADCKATVRRAMEIAREAGVTVSFDPNIRLKLWPADAARDSLLDLLPLADWVLAGHEEVELLTGHADPERGAAALLEMGPTTAVVKLGEAGAVAMTGSESVSLPAFPVEVVDTIGAGDAFNAGFISGRLRGWPLGEAVRLGTILGALATTVPDDVEGAPTWAEIQKYFGGEELTQR